MHMHKHHGNHGRKTEGLIILSAVKKHTIYHVAVIDGGREVIARLSSMGIFPGVQLTVSNNSSRGPLVVHVLDSRVMLSRGLAEKILVE